MSAVDGIDWGGAEVMAMAEEIRNSPLPAHVLRKIKHHRDYVRNREKRLESNRAYRERRRETDPEDWRRSQLESSRRYREAKGNERRRLKYHADADYRERCLKRNRERYANRTEEQIARDRECNRRYNREHEKQIREYQREYRKRPEVKAKAAERRRRWMEELRRDPERYEQWKAHRSELERARRARKKNREGKE